MKYRILGKTSIEVSEMVFGAGAVGGLLIRADPSTRVEAVRRALDHGMNWIDTAPSYGDDQSEENLGAILKELGATPYLSTLPRWRFIPNTSPTFQVRSSVPWRRVWAVSFPTVST